MRKQAPSNQTKNEPSYSTATQNKTLHSSGFIRNNFYPRLKTTFIRGGYSMFD